MATPKSRSVNQALREGAEEGSEQRIGKDWGGQRGYHIAPEPPCHPFPDVMTGVVCGTRGPEDCA